MKPLSINSDTDRECFGNYIRGNLLINLEKYFNDDSVHLENWRLNVNYWTAGKNASDGLIWCPDLKSVSNASAYIFNYSSSETGGKECLQLKIIREAVNTFQWRLQFKSCHERLIFACEVCSSRYSERRVL